MTGETNDITVTDAENSNRFEAHTSDGTLAGFLEYIRSDDLVIYPHTQVEPAFEGQGVGGALARVALDDARARGVKVRASCPFVAGWLVRHPEYKDLQTAS
ncbi:MAG TPA: GNAT family N-acetyltransferase [Actinocrinis sp.]|nr:GNAT family N-acetyltransferase [Actinocrinis sp.]